MFQDLLNSDESIRRKVASSLLEQAESSDRNLVGSVPELLGIAQQNSDDLVTIQIAEAVATICEKHPSASREYSREIIRTIEVLSNREITNADADTLIDTTISHLFRAQKDALISDKNMLKDALPLLFKTLKQEGAARYVAYTIVSHAVNEDARILEEYTRDIIQLVAGGMTELSGTFLNLYHVNSTTFHSEFNSLMRIFNTQPDARSFILSLFLEIAKDEPALLTPHVELLLSQMQSAATAPTASMALTEIARASPQSVYAYIERIQQSMKTVDSLKYTVPPLLGIIGQHSETTAREVIPVLGKMLEESDPSVVTSALIELRNLGHMNQDLLGSYMPRIRSLTKSTHQHIRDQANLIIDHAEGRDLRSLASQIDEQNKLIREAAVSVDALKKYLDDNIEDLKHFIAGVVKKLPVPVRFSTEGRAKKTLRLHFSCGIQTAGCLYPRDREFVTETTTWNKWLKLALSAVSAGVSMLNPLDGTAIDQVRNAYQSYKTTYDKEFLAFINEPFLTSAEQDSLVTQLRDARFFDVFKYDPTIGNWACIMCVKSK